MYASIFAIITESNKKELKIRKRKKFKKEYNITVYAWIKQLQACQLKRSTPI